MEVRAPFGIVASLSDSPVEPGSNTPLVADRTVVGAGTVLRWLDVLADQSQSGVGGIRTGSHGQRRGGGGDGIY
jgi:hypothetical protein